MRSSFLLAVGLDDSVELATRDVEIGADECGCHIESSGVPMRIVLP